MSNPSRAIAGHGKDRGVPQTMAASQAPVSEPRPASKRSGNLRAVPTTRPLSPDEAERIAREMSAERAQQPLQEGNGNGFPSLPPLPRAPAHLTPLMLMLVQVALDLAGIASAFILAYWLRFNPDIRAQFVEPDVPTYVTMLVITLATQVLTFYFSKLYNLKRGASRVDEFYKIAAAVSVGTVLSLAINSLLLGDKFIYSRQILLIGWLLAIVFVTILRGVYSVVLGELRKAGIDRARVLIVGAGPTAREVIGSLDSHRTLGYKVVGAVADTQVDGAIPSRLGYVPVLGDLHRLATTVRRYKVDEVIVALSGASDEKLREVLGLIGDESVSVKIYPDAFQLMTQYEVSVGELSGLPLLNVKDVALRGWNRRLKRAFDILFSLSVLVITAPLMLLIALGIKLTSPGPVFFIQERVGLDGMPFELVKFRTMRVASSSEQVAPLQPDVPGWTVRNDPRRTPFGALLRRFSLDELPQFYNVLIGEMSVVGPRPEQPEYVREFSQRIRGYMRRHREKAGITGWAQVNGLRGDSSIEQRAAYDIYYVENWSILFDLKIIVRTMVAMFRGKNAY